MFSPDLLNRFTSHLKEALQKALSFAVTNGRDLVEPGDLIVGLLHEKGSIGYELLQKAGCTADKAEAAFRGTPGTPTSLVTPDLSPAVKRLIEKCVLTAHLYEHKYVGTEHLLSALIGSDHEDVKRFFETTVTDVNALRDQVIHVLKSTSRFPDVSASFDEDEEEQQPLPGSTVRPPAKQPRASALDTFARDLTKPEHADALDPVIGRQSELGRVIEILCRRTKNNPILLGEPGVGKTAVVEGLAKCLASGDVPDSLYGKRLLSLDLALTVAGTMYRGEFEARLKQIVEEAKLDPNVILFIDEIHTIVGAGSTTGSLDAANILKPALARGEIRCIGATTWSEYKKHIEQDAALERRFQTVTIEEPTADATRDILEGLKKRYADHHRVQYAPDTLAAAVRFAERYLTDRLFPDKAIDLLDEAAASVVSRRHSYEARERLTALELAIDAAHEAKTTALQEGRFDDAHEHGVTIDALEKELGTLEGMLEKQRDKERPLVTAEDVARVVSRMANVSLPTILATDRERLSSLETSLKKSIVGQDQAVTQAADIIRRSRLGFGDPRRPKAALLFVGPSGTGKTELARAIAKEVFGREDSLIKIDMSEFAEGHTVSKLVGSPAGYVGYRDSNKLTDAVRKRPHAVVLFDEFEKAHVDVQHLLLQLLEDGQLADGTGRSVSFRHSYVILTSNVGSDHIDKKSLGFGSSAASFADQIKQEVSHSFRPELLNRLDTVVVFHPLGREHLKEILRRELRAILNRVESAQRVACSAGDDVLEWLLSQPLPAEEGARAVRRLVEREVTSHIGRLLIEKPRKKKIRLRIASRKLQLH